MISPLNSSTSSISFDLYSYRSTHFNVGTRILSILAYKSIKEFSASPDENEILLPLGVEMRVENYLPDKRGRKDVVNLKILDNTIENLVDNIFER